MYCTLHNMQRSTLYLQSYLGLSRKTSLVTRTRVAADIFALDCECMSCPIFHVDTTKSWITVSVRHCCSSCCGKLGGPVLWSHLRCDYLNLRILVYKTSVKPKMGEGPSLLQDCENRRNEMQSDTNRGFIIIRQWWMDWEGSEACSLRWFWAVLVFFERGWNQITRRINQILIKHRILGEL